MISPEFITIIITAGSGLFMGGVAWSKSQDSLSSLNRKIDEHIADDLRLETNLKSQLTKQWEWKDNYEKEAAERRLDIQKQIGRIEARTDVHDGYYQQVLQMLNEIKQELKELRK